ncbi:MAG TPA: Dickkopf N-terminal cysteine-rich domain-containing protein [Kofleriaceae bacterium]|nr:Dickkopf N-terminal cysteine-rich domain-containing protein [Kofleriaceae bacterium]
MVLASGLASGLIACGGDDGGAPSINTTADNVCDQVSDVACYNLYKCCSEGEIEKFLDVTDPRTADQCRADVHTLCERQVAQLEFSVKNKRVTFDSKTMDTCLKAIVAPDGDCATIDSMLPWTDACMTSAWTGTVATAGACDFNVECAKDNLCGPSRTCVALPTDGMPCLQDQCATGAYCDGVMCHVDHMAGEPCSATSQCQKDLFCDLTAATHTCTALHAAGEMCSGTGTCMEGETCLAGTCSGSTQTCDSATDCNGHCAGETTTCFEDEQCSTGTCSGTTTQCFSQTGCVAPSTCVFPIACVHPTCDGAVCADAHITVDYCTAATTALPL